jgi:hypothetical protein
VNKIEARIHRRFVVLARRRLSERPDDLERVLQLLAGRRGKGLVRRLAVLWREECRPRFYDAELRIVIDDWCAFKGDATKFRAPVKWTPELLAEMKKYREAHGTKATAAKYGISASLVRAKVPLRLRQGK